MSKNDSMNENLGDIESISSSDTLDSFIENMNQDKIFDIIDHKINEEQIIPNYGFYTAKYSIKKANKSKLMLILYRISDTFVVLFLIIIFLVFIQ